MKETSPFFLTEFRFRSELYLEYLSLRDRFLRRPLGLQLNEEDLRDESSARFFGALTSEGKLIGGCLALPGQRSGERSLRQMVVAEDFRRRSAGRRLLRFAELELAREDGVCLFTLAARETALPFYLASGWIMCGPRFLDPRTGLPHVPMEKTPVSSSPADAETPRSDP